MSVTWDDNLTTGATLIAKAEPRSAKGPSCAVPKAQANAFLTIYKHVKVFFVIISSID